MEKKFITLQIKGGGPQIYKFNLESSEVTRVTFEGKYNLYPSLSYDGKLLLYLTQDQGNLKWLFKTFNPTKYSS